MEAGFLRKRSGPESFTGRGSPRLEPGTARDSPLALGAPTGERVRGRRPIERAAMEHYGNKRDLSKTCAVRKGLVVRAVPAPKAARGHATRRDARGLLVDSLVVGSRPRIRSGRGSALT